MYPVELIARYIIDYSCDMGKTISNLRLQKILYFVQAEFLVTKDTSCFNDEIYAWNLGPVVPSVYHIYKEFGGISIPSSGTKEKFYRISEEDKALINEIVDQCNKFSTSTLVQWTHEQDPWINAMRCGANTIISKASIQSFFSEE